MKEPFDLAKVPEKERLGFYGALFAIAAADGQIDKDEMELIFGVMDLEGMSEDAKSKVYSYVISPPPIWASLVKLANADERLRFGLMINLIDTAWANDEFDANEEKAIVLAQKELKITDEQLSELKKFIKEVRRIRDRGLDDNHAADAVKTAASGLSAVGVPLAAVWFSGSVIGFSAAGITSGLAALGALVGIGGMIPGLGVAIAAGAGIFMGVNMLLDTGDRRKKEEYKAKQERKAQLVIKNMQEAINRLISEIAEIQEKILSVEKDTSEAEANKEVIKRLTERLKSLQQSVAKRKRDFEDM